MWKYQIYFSSLSTVRCAFVFGCWKHESDVSHASTHSPGDTQHATALQSGEKGQRNASCVCVSESLRCVFRWHFDWLNGILTRNRNTRDVVTAPWWIDAIRCYWWAHTCVQCTELSWDTKQKSCIVDHKPFNCQWTSPRLAAGQSNKFTHRALSQYFAVSLFNCNLNYSHLIHWHWEFQDKRWYLRARCVTNTQINAHNGSNKKKKKIETGERLFIH